MIWAELAGAVPGLIKGLVDTIRGGKSEPIKVERVKGVDREALRKAREEALAEAEAIGARVIPFPTQPGDGSEVYDGLDDE